MLDVPSDVERLRAELPGLASGRQILFGEMARLAKPEVELTVSEFADKYRVVSPESGSPFPGRWRTDRVPYLREPMDCLHPDHPSRRVTLKFSAQTGKSEVGVNWFCYIVDRAPGPMLTVLPTGAESVKYNRVKIQPTVDASHGYGIASGQKILGTKGRRPRRSKGFQAALIRSLRRAHRRACR
jgi:phage terminase large subunit GpA-like protein